MSRELSCAAALHAMPLEKRGHVLVGHKLAAPRLLAAFTYRGARLIVQPHWCGAPGCHRQQHFGCLILFGLRQLPHFIDRFLKLFCHTWHSIIIPSSCAAEFSECRSDFRLTGDFAPVKLRHRLIDRGQFVRRGVVVAGAPRFDVAGDFGEFVLVLFGPGLSALQQGL